MVGNAAYTWIDGHPIDKAADGETRNPKCLNPLGSIDVTTFPRLCIVGYYAGENTRVSFPKGIHIRNLREPGREIAALDSEGKELAGAAQEIRDPSCHALPMLRRKFTVNKELKKARLYATARGIYSIRVNGAKIGDGFFAPGASQFDRHLMYQTYDVTEALKHGTNIIGCILASGWWSDAFSFRLHNYNYWGDKPSFLACLILTYDDGTEDVIVTDIETWDYFGEGPFLYAGFFNGEHFDARRTDVLTWFFQSETDNLEMKRPALNATEPEFVGHYQAPVRAAELLSAKSVMEPRKGVYIYDLGQEIAGIPVLTFHEKAGQRICIRYGEMLYPEQERYKGLEGLLLQANLREASNTDI